MRRLFQLALLCLPLSLVAQESERVVSPGMTRAQVIAALGQPSTARTAAEFSYLFYPNSCGRACGMNDLVILHGDSVVDAIFRSPNRHYTGTSSSPTPVLRAQPSARRTSSKKPMTIHKDSAHAAAKPAAKAAAAKAAAPTSPAASSAPAKQMKPPATANDARPSIPVNPATIHPAPAPAPAPTKKPNS
jgi:outer membrane protein assembly factor BamE (lipoprotein component of BamABCDE complex)